MGTKLQDKIAVVTGSSSGNGRAIALALAAEGAQTGTRTVNGWPSGTWLSQVTSAPLLER